MIDILAIGAHPDDVEIGMGGSILNFIGQGLRVAILDLTNGEPTPMGTPEKRAKEASKSAKILKVKKRITLDLPNRYLTDTPSAREKTAEVFRELKPKYLFTHYPEDGHPDHIACSNIIQGARFYSKLTKTKMKGEPFYPERIFYFFSTHIKFIFKPAFILNTSDYHEQKIRALKCYTSQFAHKPDIFKRITSFNNYWGLLIKRKYAEPFCSQEEIGLENIKGLI